MNPYTPPEPPKSERYICEQCKQPQPTMFDRVMCLLVAFLIIGLATHGLMTLAKQYGIVDPCGSHFWFERPLHEWIWSHFSQSGG